MPQLIMARNVGRFARFLDGIARRPAGIFFAVVIEGLQPKHYREVEVTEASSYFNHAHREVHFSSNPDHAWTNEDIAIATELLSQPEVLVLQTGNVLKVFVRQATEVYA